VFLLLGGFDTFLAIARNYSTTGLGLKQKRRRATAAYLSERNFVQATGAIRGSPLLLKPRIPMHKKMLPDCSYLIMIAIIALILLKAY